MGARWYSPSTGGFTARDSISLPSSPSGLANRYSYGRGAPTSFVDPDGHQTDTIVAPGTDRYNREKEVQRSNEQLRRGITTGVRLGKVVPGLNMFAMGFDVAFGGSDPAVNLFVGKPKFNNFRQNKPTTIAGNPFSFLSMLTSLFGQLVNLGRQLRDLLAGIRWPSGYGVGSAEVVWDPSVAARAEAENTAKTVALSPPLAATQPIIEGGVVSTSPLAPASKVAVEAGDVRGCQRGCPADPGCSVGHL